MSKDKHHSEEFERYLSGQMGPKEAHTFERKMLDDPFATEALEGFESTGVDALKDVDKLKRRMRQKEKRRYPFLRVAAAVAMLVVASLAVFYLAVDVQDQQLASSESVIDSIVQDSIGKPEQSQIAEVIEQESIKEFDSDGLKVADKDEDIVETFLAENEIETQRAEVDLESEEAPQEKVSATVQPAEVAEIQQPEVAGEADFQVAAVADEMESVEDDELDLIASESIIVADVGEKREETRTKKIAARSASARSSEGIGFLAEASDSPARPSVGDSLYQKYLYEHLIYPDDAKSNRISGEVILDLTINQRGKVKDITIRKSLGYGCDAEAIRLIKEGSRWVPAIKNGINSEDTVSVSVWFRIN